LRVASIRKSSRCCPKVSIVVPFGEVCFSAPSATVQVPLFGVQPSGMVVRVLKSSSMRTFGSGTEAAVGVACAVDSGASVGAGVVGVACAVGCEALARAGAAVAEASPESEGSETSARLATPARAAAARRGLRGRGPGADTDGPSFMGKQITLTPSVPYEPSVLPR
jgi:hypothetical protein